MSDFFIPDKVKILIICYTVTRQIEKFDKSFKKCFPEIKKSLSSIRIFDFNRRL